MPITDLILKKYLNPYFVETGSHVGNGIEVAINSGFNKIISIELSEKYYGICKERFINNIEVSLVLGDAELVLSDVINKIDDKITFWLDGHDSGGDTAFGLHGDPIYQELDIIKNHKIKDHTIIVDDIRGMDITTLKEKILEINKDYNITYEDGHVPNDLLVAKII